MQKEKIGIIGVGHLGTALDAGLSKAGYQTLLNNGDQERTWQKLNYQGIELKKAATLQNIAEQCQMLLLCVKHTQLAEIGCELNRVLNDQHIVLSFLAQATLEEVETVLKYADPLVAKVMTTLGVTSHQGVSAYQLAEIGGAIEDLQIRKLLEAISGQNCVFEFQSEEQMQLFTVVVGCFPGILAHFLDQLNWAVTCQKQRGFAEYQKTFATLLRSTADLLDEHGSAQELRNNVSTKGGITQAMIQSLGNLGLTNAVQDSVIAGMEKMHQDKKRKKI